MLSIALVGLGIVMPVGLLLASVAGLALIGSVLASVHHAEVVAHRVGEPRHPDPRGRRHRDRGGADRLDDAGRRPRQVGPAARHGLSAIMIICNGAVGLCVLVGGLRHRSSRFRLEGANAALAALIALATLSLVLPTFTTSSPGASYTSKQLAFAAVASLLLSSVSVLVQTIRHRDYFLPPRGAADESAHAAAAFAERRPGRASPCFSSRWWG